MAGMFTPSQMFVVSDVGWVTLQTLQTLLSGEFYPSRDHDHDERACM
jgi:hypothetical protein